MTPEQFAYWFQGFAELSPTPPTQEQWDSMCEHVATVFRKVTSQVGMPAPTPVPQVQTPLDLIGKQYQWPYTLPGSIPVMTC